MADHYPLRIVYVSGVPTIGEFQSGDTVPVDSGGTGVSSLGQLADLLNAIPGGALSSLTDDVALNAPGNPLDYGDVLTWNGSNWINNHVPHLEFGDYSGAPYNISSISFLTNLGSITLQEGEIAWDGTASTLQVQTDASTTQLAVLQVSSASNDGDILLWDGTKGYYYPTSAFVDVSSQVDVNTSALENTLDASDLSVELSAISTELSAISIELSSIVSSIHLSGLGDVSFTDLSTHQHIVYDGASWVNAYNDTTEMRVRNGTASPMSKGDVIAIQNAHNQNLVNVVLADASQTSAMPALGILEQDLAVGEEGIAITFGKAQGLNTSGLTEGATAYVSPFTPGTITETKPTDTSHLIQNIGIIMRAHPSNGAIKVTGIGRANDVDNVTRDKIQYVNGSTVMPAINSNYSGLTEWTEGSGAMADWNIVQTSNASSNVREFAPDPFNGSSIVWKAYDDGPGDGSFFEGGFRPYTGVDLDTSKDHRFSVFVKQHDNFIGKLYMGLHVDSTPQYAVFYQNLGTWTNNPYFKSGWDNPEADEWYLCVGYANAAGTTSGTKNYGDVAGIYDMHGNRVDSAMEEFTFSSTAIKQSFRAFYYDDGDNDAAIGASFWHPRIDVLDGNEPSIRDLLKLHTTQHGQLDGLDQNDHPQYVLSSTNSALSSTVTSKVDKELLGHYLGPWEEGTGHQAPNWYSVLSSIREFDTDPFGDQSIIWKAIDHDVTSGDEGGINSGKVPADVSSIYRYSIFIKQDNTTSGRPYFGPSAFSSMDGHVTDPVNITRADFASGTGSVFKYFLSESMPDTEWYLAVAYLLPYGTGVVANTRLDTGLYKVSTGEKVTYNIYDHKFDDPTAIALTAKAYHLFNPGGTGDTIQFFQPRIDIVDGNEPSIADLLHIVPRTDYVLTSTNSALSSLVTSIETSTVDISSYIAANEGTWSTGGGGGVTDHGALTGLADNDHPQYVLSATNNALSSLVTNIETSTVDISSYIANNLFSGNIEVTGTNPLHIGTIGTTDAATFGVQSDVNTGIVAPSIILSATTAYQFRKNGSTTYTDTDFPQSCRDWDSAYNTVLNSSGSWGGGGGGGTSVQTPIVSGSLYHFREGFINSINNRDVETGTFWVAGGNGVVVDVTDYNDDTRSSVAAYVNSAGDRWTYWPIPNFFRTANAADGDEMLLEARVKLTDSTGTGGGISLGFVDWDGNNAIAYNTAPPADETYAEDHANIHFDIAHTNVQIAHLDSGGGSTPTVTDLGASYPMSSYVDVWYRVAVHIKYNSVSTNWDVQFYINGSAVGSSISHSLTGSIVPFVGAYYGTGAANTFIFNVDWFDVQFKIGDDASEAYLDMTTL